MHIPPKIPRVRKRPAFLYTLNYRADKTTATDLEELLQGLKRIASGLEGYRYFRQPLNSVTWRWEQSVAPKTLNTSGNFTCQRPLPSRLVNVEKKPLLFSKQIASKIEHDSTKRKGQVKASAKPNSKHFLYRSQMRLRDLSIPQTISQISLLFSHVY